MLRPAHTALYTDGITALRGAFSQPWVERMRDDIDDAFADAIARPGWRGRPRAGVVVAAP